MAKKYFGSLAVVSLTWTIYGFASLAFAKFAIFEINIEFK